MPIDEAGITELAIKPFGFHRRKEKWYNRPRGSCREELIADEGHCPYIEKPTEFNALFHGILKEAI